MIQPSNEVKAVKAMRGKRWEQTKCVWRHDVEEDMEVDHTPRPLHLNHLFLRHFSGTLCQSIHIYNLLARMQILRTRVLPAVKCCYLMKVQSSIILTFLPTPKVCDHVRDML